MKKMLLSPHYKPDKTANNQGEKAEQALIFTDTGKIQKPSRVPYDKGCDYKDISIKTARATISYDFDIQLHLTKNKAERFAYILRDLSTAYIMTKTEYIEFIKEFGYIDRDSSKRGGRKKIRLRGESKKMRQWLESH